jgi:hypothetical protein
MARMVGGEAASRYTVQVLLPRMVELAADVLHRRLCSWQDGVQLVRGGDRLSFAIPTADLPLLVSIFQAPPEAYAGPLNDALLWTPAWNERWDDLAERCRASVVIAMTAQRPINHASKLLAFLAVLDTVLGTLADRDRDAAVLHWLPAQQLMTFDRYRALRIELGPCGPAVNIRIANATGRPGELLADTVGLADLGLPDLQVVFTDRDPAEVRDHLQHLVRSIFVGDRLDCVWIEEAALVPPERDALTLLDG